jgi:serine acetyltransferase
VTVALAIDEVVVALAIPFLALVAIWLITTAWVFALARWSRSSPLRRDLEHRVAARQRTRSGAKIHLSVLYVASALALDNCVQATVLYRVSNSLTRHRLRSLARTAHAFSKFLTNADISPQAMIGPGFYLYHGLGTVIGKGTTIGRDAVVCQNVTTGGGPTIGDDVTLWAGAKVIGRVAVGDRSEVGANGVVITDIPPDTIAVGVPAERHIRKSKPTASLDDSMIDS